jgi:predicted outer membrane protein
MVKDHTRTLTQLKKELGVPDSHVRVTAQNQADAERLLKLFGFDFDREFAGQSVSDYQTMVNFLEIQSKGTNNPFAKTARELKSKAIEDMLQAENLRQMLATGTTVPEKGNVYSGRGTPLAAPSTVPSANDGGPIR